jgi:hypothetical protein
MIRALRRAALPALLVTVSTALALGGVELLLRARPHVLGAAFANGVLSKYTDGEGGIYYRDRVAGMRFMIPNFTARMYANGYTWTHQTDALGFRNRRLAIPADIALLGDSYIYGHGVDVEFTVAAYLEELTGLSVANLARQGDCALQQAYLVSEFVPLLRPRYVFYFFFENDIADLYVFLDDAALQAFVDRPLEEIRYPHRMDPARALRERDERLRQRSLVTRVKQWSYAYRAWRWLRWRLGPGAAQAAPRRPGPGATEEGSLGWRYTEKAILYMREVARQHGARFAIVPITPLTPRHGEILLRFATSAGIDFIDTSALVRADASLWLPGDEHLSPAGARRLAELAAAYVAAQPPIVPPAAAGGGAPDADGRAQSLGSPRTRSPRMLRRISVVPARMPLPRASSS